MESNFKRIDPAVIPEMFRKHRMQPRQHEFCCEMKDGTHCCCINTILVAEAVGRDEAIVRATGLEDYLNVRRLCPVSGFHPEYAIGLAEGWDGSRFCRAGRTSAELAGVEDGKAAWEACTPLVKEVQP